MSVDNRTREGLFLILEHLKHSQTWIVLALYVGTEICYITKLAQGRVPNAGYYWDTKQRKAVYYNDNEKYTGKFVCMYFYLLFQ